MTAFSSSSSVEQPRQHQVFISFQGTDIQKDFVQPLVKALLSNKYIVFTDMDQFICPPQDVLLKRIEGSRIALVIFSAKYTESKRCLRVLDKIKDREEEGKLVAIPIFYKLNRSTVRGLRGQFGDAFRDLKETNETLEVWEKALKSISYRVGIKVDKISLDGNIIENVVEEVKKKLNITPSEGSHKTSVDPFENSHTSGEKNDKAFSYKQNLHILKEKLDLNKIRSQLDLMFFLQLIAYTSTRFICEGGAVNRIVENVPKVVEYNNTYTKLHRGNYGAKPERSSDAKTNAEFLDRTFASSGGKVKPPKTQVFINFRGDLRNNFVGYLMDALRRSEINVFIDNKEQRGEDLNTLFKRIEDSGIAIVVFSSTYTESTWCLEELVKIKERVDQGLLKVLPIYYKVTPTNVKRLKGKFGNHFRDKEYRYESDEPKIKRWKEAIATVSQKFALTLDKKSSVLEIDFVESIVKEVLRMLQAISKVDSRDQSSS